MVAIAFLATCTRGSGTSVLGYVRHADLVSDGRPVVICVPFRKKKDEMYKTLVDTIRKEGKATLFELPVWPPPVDRLDAIVRDSNVTHLYIQKAGPHDGVLTSVPGVKNLVHAVFDARVKHGDAFAKVSATVRGSAPVVPHIVEVGGAIVPHSDPSSLRRIHNIPASATVFCRHGGRETFDVRFARAVVLAHARRQEKERDVFFLFMNTNTFCGDERCPSNLLNLPASLDVHPFISACDAMIHARKLGETFGLSVAEFAVRGKPVITCSSCTDRGRARFHLDELGDKALLYHDEASLLRVLEAFPLTGQEASKDRRAYSAYSPTSVMRVFKEVFLDPPPPRLALPPPAPPPVYRLGDIVYRFKSDKYKWATYEVSQEYVCKFFPASVGCEYLKKCPGRYTRICFASLVSKRLVKAGGDAVDVVVHLRAGDMLPRDNCAVRACRHDRKTTPTVADYEQVVATYFAGIRRDVTILYSIQYTSQQSDLDAMGQSRDTFARRSDAYASAIADVFRREGHTVSLVRRGGEEDLRNAAVPVDEDLLLAARATAFVQSSGRYSKLMADLVSSGQRLVVVSYPFRLSSRHLSSSIEPHSKKAYIISSSDERFERARGVVARFGFSPIVHAPAVILTPNQSEVCGGAFPKQNGHRLAFVKVWEEIAGVDGEAATVVEDDIIASPLASEEAVHGAIRDGIDNNKDVVFLGGDARNSYLTMHAVYLTPVAAHILHQATLRCLSSKAAFVDQTLHCACVAGEGKRDARMCANIKYAWQQRSYSGEYDRNPKLRCKSAPELDEAQRREQRARKLFGKGFFVQDRSGGSSLHSFSNAVVASPQPPNVEATRKTCSLRHQVAKLGGNLHLVTFADADLSQSILPHFVKHYVDTVGIRKENMHIFLQSTNRTSLALAKAVLTESGLPDPQLISVPWSDALMLNKTNGFISSLPEKDWVVVPNADEFFQYPCDLVKRVRNKKLSFCANMLDRLSHSQMPETIKPLPSDIFDQFRQTCQIRQTLRQKKQRPITTSKQTLFRATDLQGRHRHFVTPHRLNNQYGKLGRSHRYISSLHGNRRLFARHEKEASSL